MKHLSEAQLEAMRDSAIPEGSINPWPLAILLSLALWLSFGLAVVLVMR